MTAAETAQAVAVVDAYLQHCEDRDLEAASALQAPDVVLVFPGGSFRKLQDMVAAAAGRYRWVRKHRDAYDVAARDDGSSVVVSRGRLYGENLHGVAFDEVRYIDIFVLRDGRIAEQHVFNDLADTGVLDRRA